MTKHRTIIWDNLKGILITLVVIGHFLLYIKNDINAQRILFFIYSFHMPLFVFISGLLSKRAVIEKDYRKVIRFVFIFLVIKVLLSICNYFVGITENAFRLFEIDDVSWYVFALAIFYFVTIFLHEKNGLAIFIGTVILACFVGYDNSIDTTLSMSRLFVFYPFFWLGYCTQEKKLIKRISNNYLIVIASIIVVLYCALIYFGIGHLWNAFGILQGKYPYSECLDNYIFGGVIRLIWYAITLVLCVCMIIIVPKKIKLLSVGENTLDIYVLHNPLIIVLMHTKLKSVISYNVFLMIASGIVLTLILSLFAKIRIIWRKKLYDL